MCKLRKQISKLTHFVCYTECVKITGKDENKDGHTYYGKKEKTA